LVATLGLPQANGVTFRQVGGAAGWMCAVELSAWAAMSRGSRLIKMVRERRRKEENKPLCILWRFAGTGEDPHGKLVDKEAWVQDSPTANAAHASSPRGQSSEDRACISTTFRHAG